MEGHSLTADAPARNGRTLPVLLVAVAGILAAMALAAFTPELYRAFRHARGLAEGSGRADGAQIGVRFYANVYPDLPWAFEPRERSVRIQPGAQATIVYRVRNLGARAITAQAVCSLSPHAAARYFRTMRHFCFAEQTLQAGQEVDLPTVFSVDPAIRKDRDAGYLDEIALSYTFYPVAAATARH